MLVELRDEIGGFMTRVWMVVPLLVALWGGVFAGEASASPSITSLSPTSGPAGTQVLITGRGLKHTTAVQFGGQAAQFTVLTGSKVRAVVPAAAVTSTITVVTPAGSTETRSLFQVTPGVVASPSYAGPGQPVLLSGSGSLPTRMSSSSSMDR